MDERNVKQGYAAEMTGYYFAKNKHSANAPLISAAL